MSKLMELVEYLQTVNIQYDLAKDELEQRNYWNEEMVAVLAKIQAIADSLPKLPVGQKVKVDGDTVGRIVEYCYVIEYEDEPSNFSTLTEDDGVEPIEEDK